MTKNSRQLRAEAAILFSSIMGWLLGFFGFLAGAYLWDHFGPPSKDPDDTGAYLCGVLLGGVTAMSGAVVMLWRSWPRATLRASQSSGSK
jgi:hypothetical protein